MTYVQIRRIVAVGLVGALLALAIAACGSSSSASTTRAASAATSASAGTPAVRSKFSACLKSHGVNLPARPAGARRRAPGSAGGYGGGFGGGGGFFGGGGGPGRTVNPKLRAAIQACGGGQGFRGRRLALSHAAVQRFVACVKQHGYSLPAPNFSGTGPVFPRSIESKAAFRTASRACASVLRPTGTPGPGGAGGGGGGAGATTVTGA
jgi:hypothetical protein